MLSQTTSHSKTLSPHPRSSSASLVTSSSWSIIRRVAVGRRSSDGRGIARSSSRLAACFTATTDTKSLSSTSCGRSGCCVEGVSQRVPGEQRANNLVNRTLTPLRGLAPVTSGVRPVHEQRTRLEAHKSGALSSWRYAHLAHLGPGFAQQRSRSLRVLFRQVHARQRTRDLSRGLRNRGRISVDMQTLLQRFRGTIRMASGGPSLTIPQETSRQLRQHDAVASSFQAVAAGSVVLGAACQCDRINVARLHFRKRSCCADGAGADQGINRARQPRSFSGVAGGRGAAGPSGRRPRS